MNCKQCGNPIDENKLICQNCGYQGPLMEEREKLKELREKRKSLLITMVKKPTFLALAIALSVAAAMGAINALRGDVGGLIETVLMVLSAVGLWGCYFAKDNNALSGALRNASLYDAYNRIIYTILAVVDIVVFGLVSVVLFILSADKSGPLASSGDVMTVIAVMVLVVGAISVAIKLLFRSVYKKRREYFLSLSRFAESGSYTADKPSPVGSYVIGVMSVLSGLSSMGMSLLAATLTSVATEVISMLAGAADLSEFLPLIETMLIATFGGLAFGGISKLAIGLYYILSAVWMTSLHEEAVAANSAVDHQNVRRLDLERRSKAEFEEWEKEKMRNSEFEIRNDDTEEKPVEEGLHEEKPEDSAATEKAEESPKE